VEARSSATKRVQRDVELCAWLTLDHGQAVALLDYWEGFDARTRAREAQEALAAELEAERLRQEVEDSRPSLLRRVDAVIALLVDQLAESGYFDRPEAS
jgi:hypothetical protein